MTITAISGTRRAIKELVDGTIRVQIDVDPQYRKAFFELLPDIDMPVAIAPLNPILASAADGAEGAGTGIQGGAPQESRAPGRSLAQHLHAIGYFRNPKLWLALHDTGLYTVQEHKQWLETQQCAGQSAFARQRDIAHVCQGDICAHHCNSAAVGDAGKVLQPEAPQKPPHWYAVPACVTFHTWVHSSTGATREDKQLLQECAVAMMADRAKGAMKDFVGIESLSELTLEALHAFEHRMGFVQMTKWEG